MIGKRAAGKFWRRFSRASALSPADILFVENDADHRGDGDLPPADLHQAAAKLAFASDNGILWAVLRPRANAAPTSPDIVTLETVLFGVPPAAVVRSLGGRP